MGIPTVTITVAGEPVTSTAIPKALTAEQMEENLHMLYVQAVKGEERSQWIIFPPARELLGVAANKISKDDPCIMLHRTQTFVGNRAKWFHKRFYATDKVVFASELDKRLKDGWTVGNEVVVPLEKDDYLSVWEGTTPQKAIRAVDRALIPLGLSVK